MDKRRCYSFVLINVITYHSPEYDSAEHHFLELVHKASVGPSLGSMYRRSNEVI